jgi:hypothetical protein
MRTKIAFLLAVMLVHSACSPEPRADVTIQQHEHDFDFQFHTSGVIAIMGLTLWGADTKQLFWAINLNYYNEHRLRYGQVPTAFTTFNGVRNSATQNHPPLPLPPNQHFYLAIVCLHRAFPEPATATFLFSFATDNEGRISPVTRAEHITASDIPNTK